MLSELAFFPFAGRRIMIDEIVAEQRPRGLGRLQALRRVPQRRRQREALWKFLFVCIPFDRFLGLDSILDPPQAGAESGGEREIWVRVGGADAILDALLYGAARNDA